jgi:hypothetical protein
MDTPVVRLIIKAGLIPEDMLLQLKKWGLLAQETEQLIAGTPVATSLREWEEAGDFVQCLRRLIHEENATIRETEFVVAGTFKKVWLMCADENDTPACICVDAVVDKMGRVFVASRLLGLSGVGGWNIKSVSFAEHSTDLKAFKPVIKIEVRHEGEKEIAHVVYVQEEEATRAAPSGNSANGASADH